jgi:SPW repeat-containing protein
MAPNDGNRYLRAWQSNHWQDWANLVLAVWLFISPWVINFGGNPAAGAGATPGPVNDVASNASWNAWILGIIVFLVAVSAISRLQAWQEWINLLLGIWVFIAPWALGFTGLAGAAWDHWIVGALFFILAVWDLQTVRNAPAVSTAEPGYAGNKPDLRR